MTLLRTFLLAAVTLAFSSGRAEADESGSAKLSIGDSFWIVPDSQTAKFEAKMESADRFALLATHYKTTNPERRIRLANQAMQAYAEAIEINPNSSEAHYRAAIVSSVNQTSGNFPPPSELDRVIAHIEAFERLAPNDPRLPDMLGERAIMRTKRGGKRNIELGLEDYEKHLSLIDQTSEMNRRVMSRTLSNRAELLMMAGRLEESIVGYENAIELEDGISYGYGLAVALDRDGQGYRAREVVRHYALLDPSDALTRDGTFFVPAGEIHYYQALRFEGLARYRDAEQAYRLFLSRVKRSPFAARARENLKAIKSKAASQPRLRRSQLPSLNKFRRRGGGPI